MQQAPIVLWPLNQKVRKDDNDPTKRVLSFFASDIGLGRTIDFGAIFDDAVDEGMFVRSESTGMLACYSVAKTHRNRDQDITHWELHPVRASASMFHRQEVAHYDRYAHTIVYIWNT